MLTVSIATTGVFSSALLKRGLLIGQSLLLKIIIIWSKMTTTQPHLMPSAGTSHHLPISLHRPIKMECLSFRHILWTVNAAKNRGAFRNSQENSLQLH